MGAYVLISVLVLITCILLILIVLVQNSKGGGLASNFASNNQVMGVRKTTDFLEKSTWTLAIILLLLSLVSAFVVPRDAAKKADIASEVENINTQESSPVETEQEPDPEIFD